MTGNCYKKRIRKFYGRIIIIEKLNKFVFITNIAQNYEEYLIIESELYDFINTDYKLISNRVNMKYHLLITLFLGASSSIRITEKSQQDSQTLPEQL